MAREISITFALNAALKGGFTGAFQSASASARNVASAVREMERSSTGKLGASMLSQREKIRGLSGSLKEARNTLATLQNQAMATGGGTAMLARQIGQAERKVNNLSGALTRQLAIWKETSAEAATVGGSVRKLSEEYAQLQRRIEKAKGIASSLHANQAQAENLRSQRADLQGRLLSTMATTATIALPVKLAISAEDTFADLRKVMDAPEEEMQQVFADAQEISNRTGKSFEDVIAIMTSAAQAGLGKSREELLGVADQAVKMSIAWGVSVEQAGKSMATWRSSMEMTDDQAKHTANVINALSNSMNAEAGEIDQIFTRMGPMMASAGMATQDIAALATAFKAAGAQVEVSGTAMKNFKNVMTAGSAGLTDAKKSILKFLEIDPDQLQKQFYEDSKGAILRVLEALKNVRPEEKDSLAAGLFGQESIAAISPLLKNVGLVEQAFKIANAEVDGSVDEEYANRMKTSATAISQMTQSVRNLGITAGNALLPTVGAVARGITGVVGTIGDLVKRFPRLASAVMVTGAVIAAFALGSLALGLVFNTVRTSANSLRGVFLRMASSQLLATGTTGTLTGATGAFGAVSKLAGIGARFFAGGLRAILVASGVGAVLVGLGFAINLLIDNWDAVVAAMSSAWDWLTDTWGKLGVFFTELGNNLLAIFPGIWEEICGLAFQARDYIVAAWEAVTAFFTAIGQAITDSFTFCWNAATSLASWAFEGISSIWSGAVEFFSGIVSGISGVFSGLFDWLREKFAWVFSVIDSVSGFIGKITGAVTGAWNKAFGGDSEKESKSDSKPVTATAAASADDQSIAPNAAPKMPDTENKARPSFSDFIGQEKEGTKKGKKASGGGSRGKGSSSSAAKSGNGPMTVVTLGGDNNSPQTLFVPASSSTSGSMLASAGEPSVQSSVPAVKMPAVAGARQAAKNTRILPQTPQLLNKLSTANSQGNSQGLTIDLTQNFDLISQDPASVRKVLETLKPEFEALVKKALEKISSDKRRTAYAQ